MELLFDKLGLVLMPLGPSTMHHQRQHTPQISLEQFIDNTREGLGLEQTAEVEQAESEISGFSAAGAQVHIQVADACYHTVVLARDQISPEIELLSQYHTKCDCRMCTGIGNMHQCRVIHSCSAGIRTELAQHALR